MRHAIVSCLLLLPTLVGQSWSLASRLAGPTVYLSVDATFARRLRELVPGSALPVASRRLGLDGRARELELLGRVCDLCEGTMEVALRAAERELVVHCELPAAAIARVQTLLDGAGMQRRERVGEVDIVAMNAAQGESQLCLSLSGSHLLVANGSAPIARLLGGAAVNGTLLDDVDFRELSSRIGGVKPALTLYAAAAELGRVLFAGASPVLRAQFAASGMRDARSVVVAVRPSPSGLSTTVLMRRSDGTALDGWLALTQRQPLSALLADLPRGGLCSVTLALDPKVVRKSDALPNVSSFYGSLASGCADVGLSLEQQVLQRLKGPAGVQLVVNRRQQVGAAYIAKTKTERDAERLVAECRSVLAQAQQLGFEPAADGETIVPMAIGGRLGRLRAVRDNLVITADREVGDLVARANSATDDKTAPRWVAQAFKNLPGANRQPVVGVLVVDLGDLLPEADREAAALRQHAGVLRLQPDHLRLELFSPL